MLLVKYPVAAMRRKVANATIQKALLLKGRNPGAWKMTGNPEDCTAPSSVTVTKHRWTAYIANVLSRFWRLAVCGQSTDRFILRLLSLACRWLSS